jgi:poly-gamma-glutamate capsule biosynthesis protein CapA/YwtB (metallophosphatase superfamily)
MPFVLFLFFLRFLLPNPQHHTQHPEVMRADSLVQIRLTAVGDLMCHSSQYQYAKKADGSYNFSPVYAGVKNYLETADFTIGNLETVLAADTKDFSGYPAFNTPNQYADALKEAGFDLLFTANNHSYDRQDKGVLRTIDELQKRNLIHIGTFKDSTDRDSVRILSIKGIKIAFLGYTQFSNIPVAAAKKYLVNHIDTALIRKNINKARQQGAALVLVNFHWGNEYKQPSDNQREIAKFAQQAGADVIIGEHPHVLQPVEWFKNQGQSTLDSGIVAYSLGNFFSSQQWRYSDAGVMFSIGITKNLTTNKLAITSLSYVPTWVYKGMMEKEKKFFIFPTETALLKDSVSWQDKLPIERKYLQKTQWDKIKQAHEDTKKVLQNYGVVLKQDTSK